MDIREAREGEVVVLSPDGSLAGTEETTALESKLAAVQKAGVRHLVIDCAGVGQMTSAAIRALLLTSRKLNRTRGRLVLYGMNAKVRKAFAISGFDRDFTILETRERALEAALEAVVPAARPAGRRPQAPAPATVDAVAAATPSVPAGEPVPATEAAPAAAAAVFEAPSARAPVPPGAGGPAGEPREGNAREGAARPAGDRQAALAQALPDALGVRVLPPFGSGVGTPDVKDPGAAADAVLTALGVKRR